MLEDVLASLAAARVLAGVAVVTVDADAAALAHEAGALVMQGEDGTGLRAALAHALRSLPAGRRDGVLIVPADVPAIRTADVEVIARVHGRAPAVTIVAARDGGSNALACTPADAIAPCFGHGSFRWHVRAALAAGIAPRTPHVTRIALDIDRPEDVLALLARRTTTRSHAYLATLRIGDRIDRMQQSGASLRGRR